MRRILILLFSALCLTGVTSCKVVDAVMDLIHDDDVLARVGTQKLYRAEVEGIVPAGISPEDSLAICASYIRNWASQLVYLDRAEKSLSKSEMNLTQQLEQYRSALLKYRYEQHYIAQRLDTAVTDAQIKEYYDANKERFRLNFPILKARFVRIVPDAPATKQIRKLICSDDPGDQVELENLVLNSCDRSSDFGGRWVEITVLAREFNTDYGTLISEMSNSMVEMTDAEGRICLASISEYLKSGSIPPVEYCSAKIKDIIISARKQELLDDLERDLLDDALENGLFVIYQQNEKDN